MSFVAISTIANPIENVRYNSEDLFQGDILLTPEQEEPQRSGRLGLKNEAYRWPKNSQGRVIVPYTIQASAGYSNIFYCIERMGLKRLLLNLTVLINSLSYL